MIVSLVEDDPVVLSLLAETLRAHGHEPRPILIGMDDTLESSLARIAAEKAEVVLMDVGMPVPGHALLEAAIADRRFANVRYLIASASFEPGRPSHIAGVRNIAKPYELPELLAAILGRS